MRSAFDRRVIADEVLRFVRACSERVACHLGGGVALSGAYLGHRLTRDVDIFCASEEAVRTLARSLGDLARSVDGEAQLVQDAGSFVRAQFQHRLGSLAVDLVHEAQADLEPAASLEGILVESLPDLRASKLTCILSRSEPRDLVDLLFLDRAGYPPERDLALALRKDAGIDPGVLSWLLRDFPVRPLPQTLLELDEEEVLRFRADLCERLRLASLPG